MAANSFDKIRALLVQVRNTEDIEVQEQQCFLERTQLHPEQLHCINLARSELNADLSEDYDVLFIGGAGEYSAVEDYDWMPSALSLIRDAADLSFPVFGSCWGHQLIARALGGTVVRDLARAELGLLLIRPGFMQIWDITTGLRIFPMEPSSLQRARINPMKRFASKVNPYTAHSFIVS